MLEIIRQPWSWWVSGMVISTIMFSLLFFGKSFGFSSNLRTICAIGGAGRVNKFFDFNWKTQIWNLVFLVGAIIGGFIAKEFLSTGEAVQISEATI
ncbi:MAG TPA: YeeE/YedE family protein, partial [Catalimonadaceae bacterium]|nr:YeeE/YedE family protein [Catalimonadaceae bacterium]